MMGSANRSPSPITSRSNPNLPRKSFNGANTLTRPSQLNNPKKFNFLTPANSPSEIGRRNFVGGEEKENENEKVQFLKEKLRSPSKGSKNFMAPTFSAASKFTPSPRKKILVERNDPVRTSIALSDGKATFFSSITSDFDKKLDFGHEEKNIEAVVNSSKNIEAVVNSSQQVKVVPEVPIVPKPLRKVTFKEVRFNPHDLPESCVEKVVTNLDSEHNVSCSPHEPASNILSRPKVDVVGIDFDESDSDESKLKDSCMCELSDNLSFSEVLENSETGDSRERLEDVSFVEPLVSESLPLSTPIDDEITQDSSVPKQKMKSHPRRSWKSVCLFLVLLGTLVLSATNLTTMHSLVPKELNFEFSEWSEVAETAKVNFGDCIGQVKQWSADSISYLYEILLPVLEVDKMGTLRFMNFEFSEWSGVVEISKVNFDDFTEKVKQWSSNSISYLSKMLLPAFEVDKMGPLQFMNLTILEDGCQIDCFSYVSSKDKGYEEGMGLELEEVEEAEEGEDGMEEVSDQELEEVEVEDEIEEVEDGIGDVEDAMNEVEETYSSFDSTVHMVSAPEAPDTELKIDTSEDNHISDEENEAGSSVASTKVGNQERFLDMGSIPESLDTTELKTHASEIDYAGSSAETEMLLEEKQPSTSVESETMVINPEIFIDESSQIPKGPDSSSEDSRIQAQTMIIGISLVLLGLGTVAVIIYLHQLRKKASICVDTSPISTNKMTILQQEEPSTKEVIGEESCASEMSSSQWRSSSYQKKKNTNRESLIYSSEYSFSSPSYGSFTTYETIPVKHGDGDQEIMTPVRRSSRIKKQVTSQ